MNFVILSPMMPWEDIKTLFLTNCPAGNSQESPDGYVRYCFANPVEPSDFVTIVERDEVFTTPDGYEVDCL